MIGETISHYRIQEKLGEGGMGVVYKAHDTKLDRTVALKFLPAHLATSASDKSRFVQEARAASSLNHPNVCTIHDIQEQDGQMFIVMEFVDGQTLREKRGTVTFKQAVDLGIQIADGLAAAHAKGIVHRDLKPDNIMVRRDGIAQIMDFGLAKLHGAVSKLTKEGSTVGTAGYMSPEQIQGQDVDHRSDIFSLGVLLYELFTGHLPFKGVHETALQYEIVNVDAPPMATVRPDIDPALDAIVLECLEKDPHDRFQSVAEIAKDLRKFKRESSRLRVSRVTGVKPVYDGSAPRDAAPAGQPKAVSRRALAAYAVAALCLVAAGVFAVLLFGKAERRAPVIRSTILPPANYRIEGPASFALSPDGTKLAFIAMDSSGERKLWIRSLHSYSAIALPGTENPLFPFWSPDNRFVGFFADKALKKTEASGGGTTVVCSAPSAVGGSWGDDGSIFFCAASEPGLRRVPSQGGTPVLVARSSESEEMWLYPVVLPGGKAVVYFKYAVVTKASSDTDGIYVRSLESNAERLLVPGASTPLYTGGYLLYLLERNQLMARPFDPSSLEFRGEAALAVEAVKYYPRGDVGNVTVSQNGLLVYQEGGATDLATLVILDSKGTYVREFEKRTVYDDPQFSKDGARLAVTRYDDGGRGDIWICDLARGTMSRVTSDPAEEDDPVWAPDGQAIVYAQDGQIVRKSAGGAGTPEVLLESSTDKVPYDISRDGKFLLYADLHPKTQRDLWVLPLDGTRKPVPVATTQFSEINGQFSPDGRWIVYSSNETGRHEVYARDFRGNGEKLQVSTDGGLQPRWVQSGRTIAYVDPTGSLISVDVTVDRTSLHIGTPKLLFKADIPRSPVRPVYDVTADGLRVSVIRSERGRLAGVPLNLVQHWVNVLETQ